LLTEATLTVVPEDKEAKDEALASHV
jgi:hypothetical protein